MLKKLAVLFAILGLSACATPDAQKIAAENFNDANAYFAKGKFDGAQKMYNKVMDEAPDSPYRIHALLGVADSYYMEEEFVSAAPMYERFAELYPLDDHTPHAVFYAGMSHWHDMVTVKRDQTATKNALDAFTSFAEKYPGHPAEAFAKEKVAILTDRLAEKIFLIAEYYYNTAGYISCIGRVDELLEQYPTTRFKAQALLLKAKSFAAEESFEKAMVIFLQVAFEAPGSDIAKEAEAEMKAIEQLQKGN